MEPTDGWLESYMHKTQPVQKPCEWIPSSFSKAKTMFWFVSKWELGFWWLLANHFHSLRPKQEPRHLPSYSLFLEQSLWLSDEICFRFFGVTQLFSQGSQRDFELRGGRNSCQNPESLKVCFLFSLPGVVYEFTERPHLWAVYLGSISSLEPRDSIPKVKPVGSCYDIWQDEPSSGADPKPLQVVEQQKSLCSQS